MAAVPRPPASAARRIAGTDTPERSEELRRQLPAHARERLALELPDTLAREPELPADRGQRVRLAVEAEAQLQHAPLRLWQRLERLPDPLVPQRRLGLRERVARLRVGEELAQLRVVVGDVLVQRHRRVRRRERLPDVTNAHTGGERELLAGRVTPELPLQ